MESTEESPFYYRMVKLASERIGTVRQENRFQFILIAVEELRRVRSKFDRRGYKKSEMVEAVKRIIDVYKAS